MKATVRARALRALRKVTARSVRLSHTVPKATTTTGCVAMRMPWSAALTLQ